jgi:hypothetical protein
LLQLLSADDARAQSTTASPLQPSLTDARHAQSFGRERDADPVIRGRLPPVPATAPAPPLPSGAGETGFDSTGAVRKSKPVKRSAGEPQPEPPPPLPLPGPPQQEGGHTVAPQIAARADYAEAYKPPDAPVRRPLPSEEDAYEPLGLRVGTFLVRPSIEVTRGFDGNPARVPKGESSALTTVAPELQLRSQWSRHEYRAELRGSFTSYDTLPSSNRPELDAKTFTRFDVDRDTRIDLESRFYLSTDYPGSPNLPADIAKLPTYYSYGSSAGVTRRFNRLELMLKGSTDRFQYNNSKLTDGTSSSNRDRNYDQYVGQLRASYELTPGVKPFVEIAADSRQHELALDRNGLRRDSRAFTPKVGTSFELTRRLTGEAGVGYLTRRFEDPSLPDIRGAIADASLTWQASGLTTAKLGALSRAEESTLAGVSGALRRDVDLQVDHAFRRWLIGTLKFGYGFDQYVGSTREDNRMSIGAALIYKLNRTVSLKGEYRHERLRSNTPDVDYDADVFLIGLKLQR